MMSPNRSPLHPGTKIGGYVTEQILGHGGMGDVYLARDLAQDRLVALKVLPPDATHDVRRRDRLLLEGRVLQSLRHANICSVYEVGEDAGRVFLAMEYVEGRTLHEVADQQRLPTARVIDIACQLAAALEAARRATVVHRDLKGSNVMVLPSGDVKVLDFGLAKFAASAEQRLMNPVGRPTEPGLIFGTAEFMSPEQALGREVDHRSDLFSLGVILYELLTGTLPFKGGTRMELFWSILNTQPAPVTEANPSVPPELSDLVARLLEKDARGRPQSAGRVLDELEDLRPKEQDDHARTKATRRRWVARIAGSGLGIAVVLATLPVLQAFSLWVDEAREASSLNSGGIWISTDAIYDMTPAIDRAVNPTINWIGNDGRILYSTTQRHGRSALWLKLPREHEPRFVIADAGPAAVVVAPGAGHASSGSEPVFFVRSGTTRGLYRTTLSGAAPVKVADGLLTNPAAAPDGRLITFVRPLFTGYTLWALPTGGGDAYQLTPMVSATVPFVSPDLKRVAIQQSDDVLMCDVPSCGNQATLPVTSLLGWTHDGTGLVHTGPPGASNIWVTRVADGTLHQITKFGDEAATSIAWSADGHRVAVTRQRTLSDFDWFGLFGR
jgi:predicted Ser/Thr protein kinase